MTTKIGIAGLGAIGTTVARALATGIDGYELTAVSEISEAREFDVSYVDFQELAKRCDLIIEALPPDIVPQLSQEIFKQGKDLVLISSAALLIHPDILVQHKSSESRIIVPSGALCGIDGVKALAQTGIKSARIASTKPPQGYGGAPFIVEQKIDLEDITDKTCLFEGNALEASKAFPANVNVAATLSLAGIGPEKTQVEIWANPSATGNSHEIEVSSEFSTLSAKIENTPDPNNPKTSMLAAQSIISVLKNMNEALAVF